MALPFTLNEVAELLNLRQYSKRKTANGYYTKCPFCDSNILHLKFDNKPGGGVYNCINCRQSGNAAELYAAFKHIDKRKAYAEVCQALGIGRNDVRRKIESIPVQRTSQFSKTTHTTAPVSDLNAFYSEYLDRLTLNNNHKNDLLRRGLTETQIVKLKYKSVPRYSDTELAMLTQQIINKLGKEPVGIPGFYKKTIQNKDFWIPSIPKENGYYIAVRNADGLICGMQLRMDVKSKNKYKAFSSNPSYDIFSNGGTASTQYIHFSCPINLLDNRWLEKLNYTVYLTEGPLKGQIASCLSNKVFIATQGVCGTSHLAEAIEAVKKRGFKRIVTCLDMDKNDNSMVAQALDKITSYIESTGLEVVDFNWNPQYKGIDDYLLTTSKK